MPRKATTKNNTETKEETTAQVTVSATPVSETVTATKPTRKRATTGQTSTTETTATLPATSGATVVAPSTATTTLTATPAEGDETTVTESKEPRVLSRETVLADFDALMANVESEIENLRSANIKGSKFLRSVLKQLKALKSNTQRAMKQRNRVTRTANTNSGFLKPVKISSEMSKFTGWNGAEPKSRVDVTKFICAYIKEHNLQNPEDRRQIVVDKKLGKLLNYDPAKETQPLTYYKIQHHLKHHFESIPTTTTATAVTTTSKK